MARKSLQEKVLTNFPLALVGIISLVLLFFCRDATAQVGPTVALTLDASVFTGTDACIRIQNAGLSAAAQAGTVVDARAFVGTQPCSVNPFNIAGGWPGTPLWLGCNVTYQLNTVGWTVPSGTRLTGCAGATSLKAGATLQAVSGFPTSGAASTVLCWGTASCADSFAFSAPIEWINVDANSIAEFGVTDGMSTCAPPCNNANGAQELSGLHHFRIINWTGVGLGIYNAASQHSTFEDGQIFIPGNTCNKFITNGGTALQIGTTGTTGPGAVTIRKITITYQGCTTTTLPSAPIIMVDALQSGTFEQIHMETVVSNNMTVPAIPWVSVGAFLPVKDVSFNWLEGGTTTPPTSTGSQSAFFQIGGTPAVGCTPICSTLPVVGGAGCISGGSCKSSFNIRADLVAGGAGACQDSMGQGIPGAGLLLVDYISPGSANDGTHPTTITCGPNPPNSNAIVNYTVGDFNTFIHWAANSGAISSNDLGLRGLCTGAMTGTGTVAFWGLGGNATTCTGSETQQLGAIMASSGILTGLQFNCNSGTSTSSDVIRVRKNGANTTLTCTNVSALSCSDFAHVQTVQRGDFITATDATTASNLNNCSVTVTKR
jgi:hypothetical protein